MQPSISSGGTLTYTPGREHANGSATVIVQIHDDGGTANGGIDTSTTQTFTINVAPVNDAPSFGKGARSNAGRERRSRRTCSVGLLPFRLDHRMKAVRPSISSSTTTTSLFTVEPSIASNGTLTYTLAPNTIGAATVTVQIHDDGGTSNGGVDTSVAQTFTINV